MTTDLNALRQSAEKIDVGGLRRRYRDYPDGWRVEGLNYGELRAILNTLAAMLVLIDELEACRKDAARLDWLDRRDCGFNSLGYGDYRFYSSAIGPFQKARQAIDAAMKHTEPEDANHDKT